MKVIPLNSWNILVKYEWVCPNCGVIHRAEYSPSPYKSIANDLPDVSCKCDGKKYTFYEISMFNRNWIKNKNIENEIANELEI